MQKKTALITGASGGIGYEFAKLLAKDCNVLVLVARSGDKLLEVKSELEGLAPVSVKLIAKDLALPGAAEEIYRVLENENIDVDILINNAGIGCFGKFSGTDWRTEAEMISLNIVALTHLTKLFVQGMVKRKSGKVVNVASTAAFPPGPLMSVYYASKAYILSFSEAIAYELKDTGVDVTVLCPGPTATGFVKAAAMDRSKLFRSRKPAAAADVARYGYEAMMKGKTVAIHGAINKIMTFSIRLTPRKLLPPIVRRLQEEFRS